MQQGQYKHHPAASGAWWHHEVVCGTGHTTSLSRARSGALPLCACSQSLPDGSCELATSDSNTSGAGRSSYLEAMEDSCRCASAWKATRHSLAEHVYWLIPQLPCAHIPTIDPLALLYTLYVSLTLHYPRGSFRSFQVEKKLKSLT